MSLAGHLKLKNLIVFFDNNKISIDGSTALSVSDNYKKRFESYGWSFQEINGHNEKQITKAISKASKSKKPTIISCKTIIGFGSPNKSGKASSHGSPLGDDEIALVRKKLKWNNQPFEVPQEILDIFLHSLKIACGISKGLLFHLSFFLTKDISSSPKGEP